MKEKYQQLVEDNVYVSTSSEINCARKPATRAEPSVRRKRWFLGVVLVFVCLLALVTTCVLTVSIFVHQWNEKFYGYTYIQRSRGVTTYVTSSIEQNFVQYYVEKEQNEKSWILDDFNVNLEVIKSVTEDDSVCYVTQLNYTEATPPGRALQNEDVTTEKKRFHGVMTPDLYPVTDRTFLGERASRLCWDLDVYWLRPMEDVLDVTDIHQELNITSLPMASEGRSSRTKRNIRECKSSCCWLVCCCDINHFNWEDYEKFTCKHVCSHCTKAYKQKIQRICNY